MDSTSQATTAREEQAASQGDSGELVDFRLAAEQLMEQLARQQQWAEQQQQTVHLFADRSPSSSDSYELYQQQMQNSNNNNNGSSQLPVTAEQDHHEEMLEVELDDDQEDEMIRQDDQRSGDPIQVAIREQQLRFHQDDALNLADWPLDSVHFGSSQIDQQPPSEKMRDQQLLMKKKKIRQDRQQQQPEEVIRQTEEENEDEKQIQQRRRRRRKSSPYRSFAGSRRNQELPLDLKVLTVVNSSPSPVSSSCSPLSSCGSSLSSISSSAGSLSTPSTSSRLSSLELARRTGSGDQNRVQVEAAYIGQQTAIIQPQQKQQPQPQPQQQPPQIPVTSASETAPKLAKTTTTTVAKTGSTSSLNQRTGSGQSGKHRRMYKCRYCQSLTDEKVEHWRHIRIHLRPEKLLACDACQFVTEYKHHLEYHQRNHSGYKPFECDHCDYKCVNKSMLNSHMKSHSSVYQYQCGDCKYATKYVHSLKMHLRKYNHQPTQLMIDVYGRKRGPKGAPTMADHQGKHSSISSNCGSVETNLNPNNNNNNTPGLDNLPDLMASSSECAVLDLRVHSKLADDFRLALKHKQIGSSSINGTTSSTTHLHPQFGNQT